MPVPRRALALGSAVLTSGIALTDAVFYATKGRNLLSSDDPAPGGWVVAATIVHGLTYVALVWVLIGGRRLFQHTNRWVRVLRHVLIGSLAVLAVGFVLITPVLQLASVPPTHPVAAAWGGVAGLGFGAMILTCLLLGVIDWRGTRLGHGGRVLGLLVPVLALTLLLAAVAPSWAHPAYAETVIYLGVALIGVAPYGRSGRPGVASRQRTTDPRMPSMTTD